MPFQSPDWLVPWWTQFGTDELCALVVSRGGAPIGFIPFYVHLDATKRERQLLPLGVGTTDYLDGVFAPQCGPEDIWNAVELLRKEVAHDVFCATQLREDSRLLEGLKWREQWRVGDSDSPNFLSQSEGCSRMPAVSMPELPQKIRRNAMYYRNRALRCGNLEMVQANESNWETIFEQLVRLHGLRWQMRGEEGVLVDQRVVQWHREAMPLLLQSGLLRLMSLKLDERVIAVLYSLIDPPRAQRAQYFYLTAYSPEHADLRPGTLLIAYAVERAASEGVTIIDMLRGDEGYKQIWHMKKSPTWCFTQFAKFHSEPGRRETAA